MHCCISIMLTVELTRKYRYLCYLNVYCRFQITATDYTSTKSTVNSSQRRETRRSTRYTILRCDELTVWWVDWFPHFRVVINTESYRRLPKALLAEYRNPPKVSLETWTSCIILLSVCSPNLWLRWMLEVRYVRFCLLDFSKPTRWSIVLIFKISSKHLCREL